VAGERVSHYNFPVTENRAERIKFALVSLWLVLAGIALVLKIPWILAPPTLWIVWQMGKLHIGRALQLRREGYFSGAFRKGAWVYEERRNGIVESLRLTMENTEPGHWELFVPDDARWRASVPAWASERRQEIVGRILGRIPADDVHFPKDWQPQ